MPQYICYPKIAEFCLSRSIALSFTFFGTLHGVFVADLLGCVLFLSCSIVLL